MTNNYDDELMTMMLKFDTTYFFEGSTPTIVKKELSSLENLINVNEKKINENIAVIGDMNADCKYYKRFNMQEFLDWFWAIKWDTTVSPNNDCIYDEKTCS